MSSGELERARSQEQRDTIGEPGSTMAPLEDLQRALADAEMRAGELRDQYVRSVAELDNVRKRAQRDVENANRYGLERFAAELLPVMDSLQLAVASSAKADVRSLAEGQEATLKLLSRAFEKLGIKEINPRGEPFDPTRHEAVMMQDSSTAEPDSVLQAVQSGYEINGRLLRPARVIVARGLNRGDSHPVSGASGDSKNPSE